MDRILARLLPVKQQTRLGREVVPDDVVAGEFGGEPDPWKVLVRGRPKLIERGSVALECTPQARAADPLVCPNGDGTYAWRRNRVKLIVYGPRR